MVKKKSLKDSVDNELDKQLKMAHKKQLFKEKITAFCYGAVLWFLCRAAGMDPEHALIIGLILWAYVMNVYNVAYVGKLVLYRKVE